jgi:glycosyltransferase involved in cell wall biosynthesis
MDWMSKNTTWYPNIRYVRLERNTGDWGGMLVGASIAKGDYIVQLDNDIIPCEGWLTAMLTVLKETSYRVVMLKRDNVAWKLKPLSPPKKVDGLLVTKVERAVACYMMSKEDFDSCAKRIPERLGAKSKYIMAGLTKRWKGLSIGKILNKTCIELEADFQRQKYSPKNPQIWEKV